MDELKTSRLSHRHNRALLAFVSVVAVFLGIADTLVISHQRSLFTERYREYIGASVATTAFLMRDELARNDFTTIEGFFSRWGGDQPHLVEATLVAPNGFVLGRYRRAEPAARALEIVHPIRIDDELIATLRVRSDLRVVHQLQENLAVQLVVGSLLLTITLTIVVWWVLRLIALEPMSREIGLRRRAEMELAAHRDHLDGLVRERTEELSQANRELEREIAVRRETELALRRTVEQNRLILDSAAEGIFGVDTAGRCTFINSAALQMLGSQADLVLGGSVSRFTEEPDVDGDAFDASPIIQSGLTGQSAKVVEDIFWRDDGRAFPVEYSVHPMREGDRVTGAVVVFRDVTHARALARQLAFQASHDSLTALVNRREFEKRLKRVVETARTDDARHALLYLDLDQFKVVNDTFGHAAGDELLRGLAGVLRARLRSRDTLARLGGDEFGVLLEHCPLETAIHVANEMHQTIRDYRFSHEGQELSVGSSIGVVPIDGGRQSPTELMAAADAACYMAKESGRNRLQVYQPDDHNVANRRHEMAWLGRVRKALNRDRLALYGQLISPLRPGNARGLRYEVLVRMIEADGEVVLPGRFLPAAEKYDFMPAIDRWVVTELFRYLSSTQAASKTDMVHVNLSGATISDDDFLLFLTRVLSESDVSPRQVCFELTETAAVRKLPVAVHIISELKALGCSFALDDFGSGMSSFNYLKNLDVDFLKIDGAFVQDIAEDDVDLAMVRSINEIAQVMGKETVAEYVENDRILQRLRGIGVDYVQGFGIGRPEPLSSLYGAALEPADPRKAGRREGRAEGAPDPVLPLDGRGQG